jgi:hypothetical protein
LVLGCSPIRISSCFQNDMGISSRNEYKVCQAPTGNVTIPARVHLIECSRTEVCKCGGLVAVGVGGCMGQSRSSGSR